MVPFYDVSLRLPDVSQTTPRRLPGDSQTAPRRLPDGSQTTPRRLPDDWEANLEPALPQAPVPAGNLIQYIVLYNSPVAREEQSVLAVTNRTVLHPKLLRPPPNTIISHPRRMCPAQPIYSTSVIKPICSPRRGLEYLYTSQNLHFRQVL